MKVKAIILLIIAGCATAILWPRTSGPVTIVPSEPASNGARDFSPPSGQAFSRLAQPSRHHSISPPASMLEREEEVARLSAGLQQALTSTDPAEREFALTNLLADLVLKDAPAAARLAGTITDADLREEVLHRVAQLWAAQDSSAALAWAAALADGTERDAAIADVCLKVAETNPAEAVRMHEPFVSGDMPDPVLENLAHQWAENDFSAALAWTLERAQGEQRDGLIGRLAFVRSQTAPVEAARLVLDQIPPGAGQDEALISVLHQMALRDFGAASSWVERFPESAIRDRAVGELAALADVNRQANASR